MKVTGFTSLPALFPFYFITQQWLSASKSCHTRLEQMNLGAVCPFRCFLSFKHSPRVWMIYCLPARLTWVPLVLEPPCDSSISSLSTSHFLQCSSFSVLSIASAEVHWRNRSFIIHQTSKKLKFGGGGAQQWAQKFNPFPRNLCSDIFKEPRTDLGHVFIWGWRLVCKCIKFTTICRVVSLKRTAADFSFLAWSGILWSFYRPLSGLIKPQMTPR